MTLLLTSFWQKRAAKIQNKIAYLAPAFANPLMLYYIITTMIKLTTLVCLIILGASCNNANPNDPNKPDKSDTLHLSSDTINSAVNNSKLKPINNHFPFEIQNSDGLHYIIANIEGEGLYPEYFEIFKKNGYEGNGYCWQGHITQIIEKLDRSLLAHIDFDPEAGAFFAIADSKESQLKFVELLSPIFSDRNQLEDWIKKADRSRIDD